MRTTPWLTTALLLGLAAPAAAQHGKPHKPHAEGEWRSNAHGTILVHPVQDPGARHRAHGHGAHDAHVRKLHEHLMKLHEHAQKAGEHGVHQLHDHLMHLRGLHEAHGSSDARAKLHGHLLRLHEPKTHDTATLHRHLMQLGAQEPAHVEKLHEHLMQLGAQDPAHVEKLHEHLMQLHESGSAHGTLELHPPHGDVAKPDARGHDLDTLHAEMLMKYAHERFGEHAEGAIRRLAEMVEKHHGPAAPKPHPAPKTRPHGRHAIQV